MKPIVKQLLRTKALHLPEDPVSISGPDRHVGWSVKLMTINFHLVPWFPLRPKHFTESSSTGWHGTSKRSCTAVTCSAIAVVTASFVCQWDKQNSRETAALLSPNKQKSRMTQFPFLAFAPPTPSNPSGYFLYQNKKQTKNFQVNNVHTHL